MSPHIKFRFSTAACTAASMLFVACSSTSEELRSSSSDPSAVESSKDSDEVSPTRPEPAPSAGEPIARVDVGATGNALDAVETRWPIYSVDDIVVESGITVVPVPEGDAAGVEYEIRYSLSGSSDTDHAFIESLIFTVETEMSNSNIADEFRSAIEDALPTVEYAVEVTEMAEGQRSGTRIVLTPDTTTSPDAVAYEIAVSEHPESAGTLIDVEATGWRSGPLPSFTPAAAVGLTEASGVGVELGWTMWQWNWNPSVGSPLNSDAMTGSIGFDTPDRLADIERLTDSLLAEIPTPTLTELQDDGTGLYHVDDGSYWSIIDDAGADGTRLGVIWRHWDGG